MFRKWLLQMATLSSVVVIDINQSLVLNGFCLCLVVSLTLSCLLLFYHSRWVASHHTLIETQIVSRLKTHLVCLASMDAARDCYKCTLFHDLLSAPMFHHSVWSVITAHNLSPAKRDVPDTDTLRSYWPSLWRSWNKFVITWSRYTRLIHCTPCCNVHYIHTAKISCYF